jgi:hypothetical protein
MKNAIILHGHFCFDDMKTHEFPELLAELVR